MTSIWRPFTVEMDDVYIVPRLLEALDYQSGSKNYGIAVESSRLDEDVRIDDWG